MLQLVKLICGLCSKGKPRESDCHHDTYEGVEDSDGPGSPTSTNAHQHASRCSSSTARDLDSIQVQGSRGSTLKPKVTQGSSAAKHVPLHNESQLKSGLHVRQAEVDRLPSAPAYSMSRFLSEDLQETLLSDEGHLTALMGSANSFTEPLQHNAGLGRPNQAHESGDQTLQHIGAWMDDNAE